MLSLRHRRQAEGVVAEVLRQLGGLELGQGSGTTDVVMHGLRVTVTLTGTSVEVTPCGSHLGSLAGAVVRGVARALRAGGQHTDVIIADPFDGRLAVYAECRPPANPERLAA